MIDIRRGADRFRSEADGTSTRHSFSYGAHYDPERVGFGPVRAINTEHVAPGAGYAAHRHAYVEIVTWVLAGRLRHDDSTGDGGLVGPGTVQRLSAGAGVEHAEVNASTTEPLVFVQMMLDSEHVGEPEYAQVDLPATHGLWSSVPVHAPAHLLVARLDPGHVVEVPASPRSLVHVVRGRLRCGDTGLSAGDEAHLTSAGPYDLSAAPDHAEGGEALIWQLET